jgi:5-methylcytosine-specific restriction endonuclease McrA
MPRSRNTDAAGRPFDSETVASVWEKATPIVGYPTSDWRRDACGRVIKREAYGDTGSPHGWEVDHLKPVARGGGDEIVNLRPLHWLMNREKGDQYPWQCPEPAGALR